MSWDLTDDRAIVAEARGTARRALASWGLADLVDDVVLIVSELVGNAVTHGAAPVRLSLSAGRSALRGEVSDHGAGRPRRLDAGVAADHGRGLMIVSALADQWGVGPGPDPLAKTVWFLRCLRHRAHESPMPCPHPPARQGAGSRSPAWAHGEGGAGAS
ncbi:ATP-binding protein [Sphaerisporangium corydalis]|uniref:ATP-binding protein n=1 Tax=Sphaerisporangium corydalis TaxID=1441875 RepID=A0ABV9ECK5_9ACTN|nr:ATP-binding protein [Sphaerisporangium corydalis]